MKVLFVCHRVPFPPKRGGKIRPFNIIRHLSEQGHGVTVASLARDAIELDEAKGLEQHCEQAVVELLSDCTAWSQAIVGLATTQPSSFGYFYSRRLARRIELELQQRKYDVVFVHCSSVAPYVENVRGSLKIIDFGDVDSQKWREYSRFRSLPLSLGYWLEAVKLERKELALSRKFDLCTCTTGAELESLRNLGVVTASEWFPNGVDSEYFSPAGDDYDSNRICFVGRMDYFPNQQAVLQFCRNVLPRLRHRRPAIQLTVVGADPPESIRKLGEMAGVTVTGSVPDVRPFVRQAALTVAPLEIARGTQNKILESMAMGVPVICSPQASGGVDAVPGVHLLVADSTDAWVEDVLSILDSRQRRQSLGDGGRIRALSHHSWNASMRRLDGLIQQAAMSKSKRSAKQ